MPVCLCMLAMVHKCVHGLHDSFYLSHRGERGSERLEGLWYKDAFFIVEHSLFYGPPQILITAQQILAFIRQVDEQLKMHITYKTHTFLTVPLKRNTPWRKLSYGYIGVFSSQSFELQMLCDWICRKNTKWPLVSYVQSAKL